MNTNRHEFSRLLTGASFAEFSRRFAPFADRLVPALIRVYSCSFVVLFFAGPLRAQIAVQGETVYTMAGEPIRNGVVLVKSNKIEAVGPANTVPIPNGYRVFTAKVVTPGLIDARTVVGFSGIFNQPHDQEQLEKSAALQPELRAIDGYNARDPLVDWVRGLGVTTLHTGHAPGALISGQTMIVKTAPANLDQADSDGDAEARSKTAAAGTQVNRRIPNSPPASLQ
jgi:imidazolonepropionase-like amidohydrolase